MLQVPNNVCNAAFGRHLGGTLEITLKPHALCYTPLSNDMRVSVTPIAHILSTHVLKYVREMNKYLFWASESAPESQHRNFIDYYKKTIMCLQHKRTCRNENGLIVFTIILILFINNFAFYLK